MLFLIQRSNIWTIASIWCTNMLPDICPQTSSVLKSRQFSEGIALRSYEMCLLSSKNFSQFLQFWKFGNITVLAGGFQSHDMLRPIACEWKYLMDFKIHLLKISKAKWMDIVWVRKTANTYLLISITGD